MYTEFFLHTTLQYSPIGLGAVVIFFCLLYIHVHSYIYVMFPKFMDGQQNGHADKAHKKIKGKHHTCNSKVVKCVTVCYMRRWDVYYGDARPETTGHFCSIANYEWFSFNDKDKYRINVFKYTQIPEISGTVHFLLTRNCIVVHTRPL